MALTLLIRASKAHLSYFFHLFLKMSVHTCNRGSSSVEAHVPMFLVVSVVYKGESRPMWLFLPFFAALFTAFSTLYCLQLSLLPAALFTARSALLPAVPLLPAHFCPQPSWLPQKLLPAASCSPTSCWQQILLFLCLPAILQLLVAVMSGGHQMSLWSRRQGCDINTLSTCSKKQRLLFSSSFYKAFKFPVLVDMIGQGSKLHLAHWPVIMGVFVFQRGWLSSSVSRSLSCLWTCLL